MWCGCVGAGVLVRVCWWVCVGLSVRVCVGGSGCARAAVGVNRHVRACAGMSGHVRTCASASYCVILVVTRSLDLSLRASSHPDTGSSSWFGRDHCIQYPNQAELIRLLELLLAPQHVSTRVQMLSSISRSVCPPDIVYYTCVAIILPFCCHV
jgi:hypothetical protein